MPVVALAWFERAAVSGSEVRGSLWLPPRGSLEYRVHLVRFEVRLGGRDAI